MRDRHCSRPAPHGAWVRGFGAAGAGEDTEEQRTGHPIRRCQAGRKLGRYERSKDATRGSWPYYWEQVPRY